MLASRSGRKSFHNVSNFDPNVNLPLAWPSYLSDSTRGDSQSLVEREPLRSKDRGLLTYNIDDRVHVGPNRCTD